MGASDPSSQTDDPSASPPSLTDRPDPANRHPHEAFVAQLFKEKSIDMTAIARMFPVEMRKVIGEYNLGDEMEDEQRGHLQQGFLVQLRGLWINDRTLNTTQTQPTSIPRKRDSGEDETQEHETHEEPSSSVHDQTKESRVREEEDIELAKQREKEWAPSLKLAVHELWSNWQDPEAWDKFSALHLRLKEAWDARKVAIMTKRVFYPLTGLYRQGEQKATVHITVTHNINQFFRNELDGRVESLRSVLVLTSNVRDVYASTCETYVDRFWPLSGSKVLDFLIKCLGSDSESSFEREINQDLTVTRVPRPDDKSQNFCHILEFKVTATLEEMMSFTEQISWLAAVLNEPISTRPFHRQTVDIEHLQWTSNTSEISIEPKMMSNDLISPYFPECWHKIVSGAAIANEFPIPNRPAGLRGLELTFDVMTVLGSVWGPSVHGTHPFLKSPKTALVPTSFTSKCVQWHFASFTDFKRDGIPDEVSKSFSDSFEKDSELCDLRRKWEAEDRDSKAQNREPNWNEEPFSSPPHLVLSTFAKRRAIVGYWPKFRTTIGDPGYLTDAVRPSRDINTDEKKCQIFILPKLNPTVGTSGMGFAGIQVTGEVIIPRSMDPLRMPISPDDMQCFENSTNSPLLLFDVPSKRGWLIPELLGISHLFFNWLVSKSNWEEAPDEVKPDFENGFDAEDAMTMIKNSWNMTFHPRGKDSPSVQASAMFRLFYRQLSCIKQSYLDESKTHLGWGPVRNPLSQHVPFLGVEFADLVSGQDLANVTRIRAEKGKAGAWCSIISGNPKIPVLVGDGFGEILEPLEHQHPGCRWSTLPSNHYYIVADMNCLYSKPRSGMEENLKLGGTVFGPVDKDFNLQHNDCVNVSQLFDKSKEAWSWPLKTPPTGAIFLGKGKMDPDTNESSQVLYPK